MSRKGNCWDNAVAESFFKTIKTELVYQAVFKMKIEAKLAVFEYLEVSILARQCFANNNSRAILAEILRR